MKKQKNTIKKLFQRYMLECDIESFKELAKSVGMDYQTLRDRLIRPELFRAYEIKALNNLLHFSDEDLLNLIKLGI